MSDTVAVEEPVETSTEEVVVQPEAEAAAAAQEAAPPDLYAMLLAAELDTDNPDLDLVAATITPDTIKNAQPEHRALLRAVMRAGNGKQAELDAAHAARMAAADKRDADQAALQKQIRQQRQALLDMAAKAPKAPGAAPDADPFTPEGLRAIAKHEAETAAAAAWAPMVNERDAAAKANAWFAIVEKHPDLNDEKVSAEFENYFVKVLNAGRDLDNGEPSIAPAEIAAELFFSAREKARLQEQATTREAARVADRATAQRAIGRSAGAGSPDLLANINALIKDGRKDEATAIMQANPRARQAFIAANS